VQERSKKKNDKKKEMKNGSNPGVVFVSCADHFQTEDSLDCCGGTGN